MYTAQFDIKNLFILNIQCVFVFCVIHSINSVCLCRQH